jgi:hypothetical protein
MMKILFPKRNDFSTQQELEEVVFELKKFGISTNKEIRLFLKKYRRWILDGEKSPLDATHQKIYREMLGEAKYLDSIRRQYWFAYPGMIRCALAEEFGDAYETFSNDRDGV